MKIIIDDNDVPHAHGFRKKDGGVVSYSKRVYASHFIEQENNGTLNWAEVSTGTASEHVE